MVSINLSLFPRAIGKIINKNDWASLIQTIVNCFIGNAGSYYDIHVNNATIEGTLTAATLVGDGSAITNLTNSPVSQVVAIGQDTEPTGFKLLTEARQSLLRVTYPALFTAIGTTYGAADVTHFNIPGDMDYKSSNYFVSAFTAYTTSATISSIPAGAIKIVINAVAGGGQGGGGGEAGTGAGGGGGAGSSMLNGVITIPATANKIVLTIGAGGSGSTSTENGAAGTPTIIDIESSVSATLSYIYLAGGSGGIKGASGTPGAGGAGGITYMVGMPGSAGSSSTGGAGGSSPFGLGALARVAAAANTGGGGGGGNDQGTQVGGAGGSGYVEIAYVYANDMNYAIKYE